MSKMTNFKDSKIELHYFVASKFIAMLLFSNHGLNTMFTH